MQSTLTRWSERRRGGILDSAIDSGQHGGACPSGGFGPSFTTSTSNNQAGASSSFSLTLSRQDGEQRFGAFSVTLAPGMSGILKNVAQCPEPQASRGECPQASEIGTATVGVGSGGDQFYLPEQGQPANRVYLTGPTPPEGLTQSGTPFGLSIVVPALAGPFDLGTVRRARERRDRSTHRPADDLQRRPAADLVGDPTRHPHAQHHDRPCGLDRQPDQLRAAGNYRHDRSVGGANAALSSPFQAVNCATLPFKPVLTALTHAQTSRADGAYLQVKVLSGPGQANIGKVKVDLPKQLPARRRPYRELVMPPCSKPARRRARPPRSWERGRW